MATKSFKVFVLIGVAIAIGPIPAGAQQDQRAKESQEQDPFADLAADRKSVV